MKEANQNFYNPGNGQCKIHPIRNHQKRTHQRTIIVESI